MGGRARIPCARDLLVMPRTLLPVSIAAALLGLTALVSSKQSGVLPGELLVPANLTSAFPACGACHDPFPNTNGRVKMVIQPQALALAPGAPITVKVQVVG